VAAAIQPIADGYIQVEAEIPTDLLDTSIIRFNGGLNRTLIEIGNSTLGTT
jgi:hypothetical protein